MKKILITGVNGFTGAYFLDFLKEQELNLRIFGIDKNSFSNKNKNFEFIKTNLCNRKRAVSVIKDIKPDYIFHFAGLNFSNDYRSLFDYNVFATMSLLDAVVNSKNKPRILIIGSAAEYGIVSPNEQPISESVPLRPVTPYGVSKAVQDLVALQYRTKFGLDIVIARTFNIIGPGQTSQLICGSIVEQIRNSCSTKKKNNKLMVGNLYTKRDFIDIRDVVRAYWKLMTSKKVKSGEVFNVGNGKSYSVIDIIRILFKISKRNIPIKQVTQRIRKNDIPVAVADIEKIKKIVDWRPIIPIETSLREMYIGRK